LLAYLAIESLQEYVIVEQGQKRLMIYRRAANWKPEILEGQDAALTLDSISCNLSAEDIYDRVKSPFNHHYSFSALHGSCIGWMAASAKRPAGMASSSAHRVAHVLW